MGREAGYVGSFERNPNLPALRYWMLCYACGNLAIAKYRYLQRLCSTHLGLEADRFQILYPFLYSVTAVFMVP